MCAFVLACEGGWVSPLPVLHKYHPPEGPTIPEGCEILSPVSRLLICLVGDNPDSLFPQAHGLPEILL